MGSEMCIRDRLNPVVLSLTIQALLIAFFNKNKDSLPSGAAVEIELIAEV